MVVAATATAVVVGILGANVTGGMVVIEFKLCSSA